jgi:hypothetical protein
MSCLKTVFPSASLEMPDRYRFHFTQAPRLEFDLWTGYPVEPEQGSAP